MQIRARRLAKLGTASPAPSKPDESKPPDTGSSAPKPTPNPQTSETEPPKPKINITPATAATASQEASANPFSQLGVGGGGRTGGSAEPSSSPGSSRVRRKRPASEIDDAPSATQPRKPKPVLVESDEDYANRLLAQIFRVTVDPHHMSGSQGQRFVFLPGLNEELNESGELLKLSVNNLDQAIIEAANSWPQEKPLMNYLLPCWKRAVKSTSGAKLTAGPRLEVHEEAKRLCMSNCLFALTMPILYGLVCTCLFGMQPLTSLDARQTPTTIPWFPIFFDLLTTTAVSASISFGKRSSDSMTTRPSLHYLPKPWPRSARSSQPCLWEMTTNLPYR